MGLSVAKKNHKKSKQFDLVKLVGVRGEDAERRPPAQMVPISKCITTQTKYIRSEISLTNTRKYLNKCKKYPLTNTDQVLSVGNMYLTQIQTEYIWSDISQIQVNSESNIAFKYKPQIVGRKYLKH